MRLFPLRDLPVATTPIDLTKIFVVAYQTSDGHLARARLSDLFTNEEAATLFLAADILQRDGEAHVIHLDRIRKVAATIRTLLTFDPPPSAGNTP